jgi:hypothetical protein
MQGRFAGLNRQCQYGFYASKGGIGLLALTAGVLPPAGSYVARPTVVITRVRIPLWVIARN